MNSTVQEMGESGQDDHGNCNNDSILEAETGLATLIEDWRSQLVVWAGNGKLSHAAQVALQLPADHSGLQGFVSRIRRRDFSDLPPVRCLDPEAMEESPCAYSPERPLILINRDWLDHALAEQVIAVLSEELGHHLDVLFNPVDTPGDEGELFLECLRGDLSAETIVMYRRHNEESGVVHLEGEDLIVDEVGVGAMCLDLRDLPHQDAPQP
ncbi:MULTISPECIES: hypothetical protein [Synechococcales]|uniref:hypothetical protein n=1 Tax=Synechococcus sp. CS-1333 TaxID=2848638 RepID=UPI00223AE83B|nr:hypothetical protein [Synechococcus sp. CS-1333]